MMTSLLQTWEGGLGNVFTFCLVVATLRLELNSSTGHHSGSQGVAVILLLFPETISMFFAFSMRSQNGFLRKAENIEGVLSVFKFFIVVD